MLHDCYYDALYIVTYFISSVADDKDCNGEEYDHKHH